MSIDLTVWTPPPIIRTIGIGNVLALTPPRWAKGGTPLAFVAAREAAIEQPRIALAPQWSGLHVFS